MTRETLLASLRGPSEALWEGAAPRTLSMRTGDREALTDAIDVGRRAVEQIPEGHPDRVHRLAALGAAVQLQSERTGDPTCLVEAISLFRQAAEQTPGDDPDRAGRLSNLGNALRLRYERTNDPDTLDEAVVVARRAVDAAPGGHPNRAACLINLGTTLRALFTRTGSPRALAEATTAWATAANLSSASATLRIAASRSWGDAAMLANDAETALEAFRTAVDLLPRVAARSLAREDREHGLGKLAGLAAQVAGAAVAAGRPGEAVELLEQTRGVLLADTLDARSDLSELRARAPELASELADLQDRLGSLPLDASTESLPPDPVAAPPDDAWVAQRAAARRLGEQRQRLDEEWAALLARIRASPRGADFLRPAPVTRLRQQAAPGPIVIVYVSPWRADGLVLTPDPDHPVDVVPLPALTRETASSAATRFQLALRAATAAELSTQERRRARADLKAVLTWLWDAVTEPILAHLGLTGPTPPDQELPRVWWCPVGMMNYLPLHAAGHHDEPGAGGPRTVLDTVVSSYTVTIRALEHARRAHPDTALRSLVVAMPHTRGQPDLPGVVGETEQLLGLLPGSDTLTGEQATRDGVLSALPHHEIAHLACHGLSDWKTSANNRLLLYDHVEKPLSVAAISRLRLTNAELAYLSACGTADIAPRLADEAVHITAAFHAAGYRQVVGTLWPVSDAIATRVAIAVYTALTDGGTAAPRVDRVPRALHDVLRDLRGTHRASPSHWAGHIHVGR
jgi:tetratricopeptide (TPR) repeat protein